MVQAQRLIQVSHSTCSTGSESLQEDTIPENDEENAEAEDRYADES